MRPAGGFVLGVRRRWLDRIAAVKNSSALRWPEVPSRFGKSQMNLGGVSAEKTSGDSRMGVLLLQHKRDAVHCCVGQSEPGRVAACPDDTCGWLASHLSRNPAPGSQSATNRLPVLPWSGPVEGMELEELECEAGMRQDVLLNSSTRADKEGLDPRVCLSERAGDGEAGIKVTTRAASREEDSHRAGSASRPEGPVAERAVELRRVLPILTRMPVITSESTRLERP